MGISDMEFKKSFKNKREANTYASKLRKGKKFKYVRTVKSEVGSHVYRNKNTFYRVYAIWFLIR